MVFKMGGIARMELNYVMPQNTQSGDAYVILLCNNSLIQSGDTYVILLCNNSLIQSGDAYVILLCSNSLIQSGDAYVILLCNNSLIQSGDAYVILLCSNSVRIHRAETRMSFYFVTTHSEYTERRRVCHSIL